MKQETIDKIIEQLSDAERDGASIVVMSIWTPTQDPDSTMVRTTIDGTMGDLCLGLQYALREVLE